MRSIERLRVPPRFRRAAAWPIFFGRECAPPPAARTCAVQRSGHPPPKQPCLTNQQSAAPLDAAPLFPPVPLGLPPCRESVLQHASLPVAADSYTTPTPH